jgi:hypothetical protein
MKILACAKPINVVNKRRTRDHRKEIKCADCIYSKNLSNGKKVCTLFLMLEDPIGYVDTIYCRTHFELCGPYAECFKDKK